MTRRKYRGKMKRSSCKASRKYKRSRRRNGSYYGVYQKKPRSRRWVLFQYSFDKNQAIGRAARLNDQRLHGAKYKAMALGRSENPPLGWIKTKWPGNSAPKYRKLTVYKKKFGRATVFVYTGQWNDALSYTVSAGANSDASHSGVVPTLSFETAMNMLDTRFGRNIYSTKW